MRSIKIAIQIHETQKAKKGMAASLYRAHTPPPQERTFKEHFMLTRRERNNKLPLKVRTHNKGALESSGDENQVI